MTINQLKHNVLRGRDSFFVSKLCQKSIIRKSRYLSALAMTNQFTELSKYRIKIRPIMTDQIRPNDNNTYDWLETKYAARGIVIIFINREQH